MKITNRDLASQLIKTIDFLLAISTHLDETYFKKLEMMGHKMCFFLEEYDKHSTMSVDDFASYLNHDALSQLTFILGYAELFRSIHAHELSSDALQYVESICDDTRLLSENLRIERDVMVAKREEHVKL